MADPPKRPFDILRAAFWLLAVMMIIEILASILGAVLCWWVNFTSIKQPQACIEVGLQVRELWSELLTAVLALLLAARPPAPPRE